jgi:tRNA A-37 threonylcarbamoyl transferase component Bud32
VKADEPSALPRRLSLEGEGTFLVEPGLDAGTLAAVLRRHRSAVEPASILKRNRGTLVTRVVLPAPEAGPSFPAGLDAVVKAVDLPWRWRLLQRAGWSAPFAAEFRTARRFEAAGIRVPRTIAASLRPRGGTAYLVTATVSGAESLRELLWLGPGAIDEAAARRVLLRDVGAWLRVLHDRGVWQRDMKPNNILLCREGASPVIFLVDVTGARFSTRPLGEERRVRNLGQLLDLPAALDAEAPGALLAGYLGDGGEAGAWAARVRAAVAARRAARRRRTGFTWVDEEHRHGTALGRK